MATSLNGKIFAGMNLDFSGPADLAVSSAQLAVAQALTFTNGTTNGLCDLAFIDQRTISASSNEDLDLAGGLTDPFGTTITFVEVCGIFVSAAAANGGNIIIGAAATNAFVGPFAAADNSIALDAGERCVLTNLAVGWAVTAGTGDLLRVTNSDGGANGIYDIAIIGRSA